MSDDKLSDDKRILKWTVDGERWVDGEWTDETIAEDKIGYYRYKDRGMIELVGELRAEVKRLREQVECSKGGHEWELDDYLDGDPNKPVRIVETCAACSLVRERIE